MEVSVDTSQLDSLAREINANADREMDRAALAAARKAGTRAFRAMKAQADLSSRADYSGRSDRRRRVYTRKLSSKDGALLWVGFADVPLWRIRGVSVTGGGRQTRIGGAPSRRRFRPWGNREARGEADRSYLTVFERLGSRPLPVHIATEDLDPAPIELALADTDEIFEAEVLRRLDRLLEGG